MSIEKEKKRKHNWYIQHKEEQIKRVMKWRESHKDKHITSTRLSNERYRDKYTLQKHEGELDIKTEVLTHYGNGKLACVICDFGDIRALTIDHINGGGAEHRRHGAPKGGKTMYRFLKGQHYPEGYQTLCMNCQFVKVMERREFKPKQKPAKPTETALPVAGDAGRAFQPPRKRQGEV